MQRIPLADALDIAETIDSGYMHRIKDTRFAPLRDRPFLAESFLHLIRSLDTGCNVEFHRHNFVNVCQIMCPEFISILSFIEMPELDTEQPDTHMKQPEPDILSHM
jgi:hypothetical protein